MRDADSCVSTREQLKNVAIEASQALASLDAERLEALVVSLTRADRNGRSLSEELTTVEEAVAAVGSMSLLAKMLEATRANLRVIEQAADMTNGSAGYGPGAASRWNAMERAHGDN